jgi:HKD family nuclease
MGNSFPQCSTGTDDGGTIKLFWQITNGDRRLRLLCPHNADDKAYIYHQKNEEYGSEDITSAATLVYCLEWFKKVSFLGL